MSETPTTSQNVLTSAQSSYITTPEYFQHYDQYGVQNDSNIRAQRERDAGIIDINEPDRPFDGLSDQTYTTPSAFLADSDRLTAPHVVERVSSDAQHVEEIRNYTQRYVTALRKNYVLTA